MSNNSNRFISIDIKSLENQTKSVSIARNSTVLDLKNKIQTVFDVESTRQRLIFQGKVLKDDKTLSEYENLDDGKVVHLVIRPIDAPRHPENDEPNANDRSSTNRRSISTGYAVITVDATLSDLSGASNSLLSSLFGNLSPSLAQATPFSPSGRTAAPRPGFLQAIRSGNNTNTRDILSRSLDYIRQGRRPGLDGLLDVLDNRSPPISQPVPTSLESRLSRTLAYIRQSRTLLDTPSSDFAMANTRPNHISRSTEAEMTALLNEQPNSTSQIGYVMNELADLFQVLVPYLRQLGHTLRQDANLQQQLFEVLKASRIIQFLSLSNHFLGSVLSTVDIPANNNTEDTSNKRKRDDDPNTDSSSNNNGSSSSNSNNNNNSSSSSSSSKKQKTN